MKFLIDENLSVKIARSLRDIDQDVHHVTEVLYEGAPDTEVLEFAGRNDFFLITKDDRIRYKPNEKAALRRQRVGVFLLGGKNIGFLETYQQLIRNWDKVLECAGNTNRPFVRRIRPKGRLIDEVSI
jgi:predicted nuclease of predicted toxin-antitoxin system